jgi:S-adenosylmethionine:tRNA ribosyltransferase-isomerase
MLVDDYDYLLPESVIAQTAIDQRDHAKLLDTTVMEDRSFLELPTLLNAGDIVVVNETKVRSARLIGRRETGGRTEVLLTRRIDHDRWQALIKPAKKVSSGSVIRAGGIDVTVVTNPVDGVATVLCESVDSDDIEEAIESVGVVPLPPYFHGTLSDPTRYQTMFAATVGSSAAPTAALHFTPEVVSRLVERGVSIATVDLQVGLDTFRPMDPGSDGSAVVENHRIHSERVKVPQSTVDAVVRARSRGGKVVAIGTTVVRSLESASIGNGLIGTYDGETELFITAGYEPQVVDALVTNFHAPRTTLLVLIASLLGDRWRHVYEHALQHGYRFLSFGDAMYIEVER